MNQYTRLFVSIFAVLAGSLSAQTSFNFAFGGPDPLETIQDQFIFASGGVTATATAWSVSRTGSGSEFSKSEVVQWSPGIGVKNSSETITDTPYVPYYVDNQDHYDFVLFVFDKKVNISTIRVSPSAGTFDLDASYWMGNVDSGIDLLGSSFANLSSLGFGSRIDNDSVASHSSRNLSMISPDGGVNALLIGARVGGDSEFDRFKISTMQGMTAIPEPSSAALLAFAFAATLRRRR